MLLNEKEQDRNDTVCPFCGASDCTVTQKTNATVTSKFGFGSGCCGMLLLGWPGLLCGLCGSNTKTDLASETWWACKSCGKLHISTPDAIKKWEEALLGMWGNVIFAGIFYAIVRWLFGSGFLSLIAFWVGVYMPFEEIREIHQNLKNEFGASIIQFLNPAQKKGALFCKERDLLCFAQSAEKNFRIIADFVQAVVPRSIQTLFKFLLIH